ncbi:MAG: hypothetical protein ACLRIP_07440 [Blautia massiliensis (ex Durand et al. 2017)]
MMFLLRAVLTSFLFFVKVNTLKQRVDFSVPDFSEAGYPGRSSGYWHRRSSDPEPGAAIVPVMVYHNTLKKA